MRVGGAPIPPLRSKKSTLLLAYLATSTGSVRRAFLADLLWPTLTDPLRELRRTLHDLNQQLPGLISAERRTLTFHTADHIIELYQFEQHIRNGSDGALTEAVALHRGDFLATLTVDGNDKLAQWLASQRERWRESYIQLLHTLIARTQTRRDFTVCIGYARRLVEFAPWREENQRLLIDVLDQAGQPGAALDQFERLHSVLATELDAEPDERTETLITRVRWGQRERQRIAMEKQTAAYLSFAKVAIEKVLSGEQLAWLTLLDQNHNALREVIFWALTHDPTTACEMCAALWMFWRWRSHVAEGYEWVQQALAAGDGVVSAELIGRLEWAGGLLATLLQHEQRAIAHLDRSLAILRKVDDQLGLARAVIGLGARLAEQPEQWARAVALIEEGAAIYTTLNHIHGLWYAHNTLGEAQRAAGNLEASLHHYTLSLEAATQAGVDRSVAVAQSNLAAVALLQGQLARGWTLIQTALAGMLAVGDEINIAQCLIIGAGLLAARRPVQQPQAKQLLLAGCNYIATLEVRLESADAAVAAFAAELCDHYLPDPRRPRFANAADVPTLAAAAAMLQALEIER